jgi:DNA repair ATPase RecN
MALVVSIAHGFTFTFSFSKRRSSDYYPNPLIGVGGGDHDCLPMNDGVSEEKTHDWSSRQASSSRSSHIVSIRSSNIAGMVGDDECSDIVVDFGLTSCFVAVTGESGTGKSLLISKAIDLISGGKAIPSLLSPSSTESNGEGPTTSISLVAHLYEPHLSAVSTSLRRYGIDPTIILRNDEISDETYGELQLERILSSQSGETKGRLKSLCRINGRHCSLQTIRDIVGPLFARVDVGVASAALGRPSARLTMLDIGVPNSLRRSCIQRREAYVDARKLREKIEHDLKSRILPAALRNGSDGSDGFDEEQLKQLRYWVDELDSFESRMSTFQRALLTQDNELLSDETNGNNDIVRTLHKLRKSSWSGMQRGGNSDDESLFTSLIDFREEIKAAESRMVSANLAYESLASLTAPNSALVALENTRKLLFSISSDTSGPLFESLERTHELLNVVEASLDNCARSIDGELVSTLEKMAFTEISLETLDGIIADWNALARKHGISPYSLPNCHLSMREELDGNVEAMKLLPERKEAERKARSDYSNACRELSDARKEVATKLSQSVSNLLPSLGLEGSTLHVQLNTRFGGFDDPYSGTETVGVDIVEFQLMHKKSSNGDINGGSIEQVGSSGEKSRVLLAIETALPGSIGSTCNTMSSSMDFHLERQDTTRTLPIAIIYDEIDAHVGGRAAVTMAKLLADQSRASMQCSDDESEFSRRGSQIIAITHSASLAAIADRHIVVERCVRSDESRALPIRTYTVDGSSRRKEIARMASGDLASDEAETFAEALIRDAMLQREMS